LILYYIFIMMEIYKTNNNQILNFMTSQRLSKVLAAAGVASRRACEELIFAGHITVNGDTVLLPQTRVTSKDSILVSGKPLKQVEPKMYYILNKPAGYLCTSKRTNNTKIVLDLFQEVGLRLFTIGRLDKDTQGLLLVTNDGHFSNKVMHPSSNIHKEYVVKTNCEVTADHLKAISSGTLVEGVFVKPIKVVKVRKGTLKIIIGEGKKREIRHLLKAAGLEVEELVRIRIGGLQLGKLPLGAWRELTDREKKIIFGE
jgi:23S rRNA pseudouridine2605 synthase